MCGPSPTDDSQQSTCSLAPLDPVKRSRTTENGIITGASAAAANTTAESTAGPDTTAWEEQARLQQLDLEEQVRQLRLDAQQQPTSDANSTNKRQKTTRFAKIAEQVNQMSIVQLNVHAKAAPKAKAAPTPKAKAKTAAKPKAKAKTAPKPKAKAKTGPKPKAKAKTGPKPKAKSAPKGIMPSEPVGRMFDPIKWGPATIYHGGKQRKYRLKEYTGSRRTRSFSDWQTMMRYIRTL
jgi:hypothetical protein